MWIRFVVASVMVALISGGGAEAKDVAIVYDFSGSMNLLRKEALLAANATVAALLTDGTRPDASAWLVSQAPTSQTLFEGANLEQGSRLLYLAFNQPDRCTVPFFQSTTAVVNVLEDAPRIVRGLLPDPATVKFKDWTYLELAKWQAVEE